MPTAPLVSSTVDAHDPLTDRLLAAAVDVFTENGFEKAGVAAIARAAGVTTGAIYARWSGKQEMMLDALDLVMTDQLERLLSADGGDVTDILGALGAELLVRSPSADALIAEALVIARRDAEFQTMLTRRMAEQETKLARLIDDGKTDGLLDPTLPTEAIVALCHAISLGFAMLGSIDRELPVADGWNAVIQRLIIAARPISAVPPEAHPVENHPDENEEP
ncbi:MAG: TetR/AcrR family transcriptional regulator [Acidimicrobiales bacterium]